MQDINNLTSSAVEAIQDKKGTAIKVLDLSELDSAPASRLVICQGKSTAQVAAIADNIREHLLTTAGQKPSHFEGYRNSQWIIVDYGELIVHIFLPDFRTFYDLEGLWSDANVTEIDDID